VQGNYFGLGPIYGINVDRVGERMNMVKVLGNERNCNGRWRLLQSIERSNQTIAKTSRSCNFGKELNSKSDQYTQLSYSTFFFPIF